jgi:hypothetical protein
MINENPNTANGQNYNPYNTPGHVSGHNPYAPFTPFGTQGTNQPSSWASELSRQQYEQVAGRQEGFSDFIQQNVPSYSEQFDYQLPPGPHQAASQHQYPTYEQSVQALQYDLMNYFPYNGEGSMLAMKIGAWGNSRDGALREMEAEINNRHFHVASLEHELAEMEQSGYGNSQLQQQIANKKQELEHAKSELDELNPPSVREVDQQLGIVNNEIYGTSYSISSKESEIANLEYELNYNPENSGEIEGRISQLESELYQEKMELDFQQQEKLRLEAEKMSREQASGIDSTERIELENRIDNLEYEIYQMQMNLDGNGYQASDYNLMQQELEIEKYELSQMQWLYGNFEYNTRGLG